VHGNGDVVKIWVLGEVDPGNRCQALFCQCAKLLALTVTS